MGRKTYLKIVMPSAPTVSFAPYDSQTIGLTTWDEAATIDGVTYHPTRFALGDGTSTGDFSKGKGGLALGNQIASLEVENIFSGGLLKNYVDAGTIPLVGAVVTILDGVGATPQTWVLQEPSGDGPVLSFKLCTPGYLNQKRLQFAAMRYDGAATVGLAVGDAAVQGINASGRYKGVSVPTNSVDSFQKVTSIDTTPWNFGNPLAAVSRVPNAAFTAFRVVETDFSNLAGSALWSTSRKAFEFRFLSQQGLTDFVSKNLGVRYNTTTKIFTKNTVSPNTIFSITDGSNFEVISRSDSNGSIISTQSAGWIPLQGDTVDCIASDSLSGCFEEGSPSYLWGTRDNTAPFNGGTTGKFYYESGFLLFVVCEKPQTVDNVTFYALYISPCVDGSLYNSSASQVWLAESNPENPICAGAVGLVGFNSTGSSSKEAGVVIANGITKISNNIISFLPTSIFDGKFAAWTDLPVLGHIAMYASVVSDDGVAAMSFDGNISDIDNVVPGSNAWYMRGLFSFAANCGAGFPSYHWTWKFDVPKKLPNFSIDKVFTDWEMRFLVSNGSASTFDIKAMAPFFASTFTVPSVKPAYTTYWTVPFFGKGVYSKGRTFDSLDALNGAAVGSKGGLETAIHVANASVARSFEQRFRALHIYAITKLAFGSNPAVVVPGNFPGTSNPTTTPTLAAAQLAAWLGLSNISLTGGITPTAGTWGEYLGEDPSSTSSDDTTSAKDRLSSLLQEACIYGAETGGTVALPDVEVAEHPSTPSSSIDDVVTLPQFTYCYAGTSAQFTAKILNVDEVFDISKGDGYYWGGWQEKDTCHLSASPGSAVLAMCQLEDCLAVVCADGYLRCSYDGGTTWPFSRLLSSSPTHGVAIAGNGVMIASTGGNAATAVSFDAGRTWETIGIQIAAFRGGWFDETTGRLWLCGLDGGNLAAAWYSSDGTTWTKISSRSVASFSDILAVGDDIFATAQISGAWAVFRNTISGGGSIWGYQQLGSHDDWTDTPHLARWNGSVRIAIGTALWSSADLSTFTSGALPLPATSFASDGEGVVWGVVPTDEYYRTIYSRDDGATWKTLPFGVDSGMPNLTVIWDVNAWTFRVSNGRPQVMSLGDPSVLDIWLRCREAYLATSTLATDTFDKRGLYDASELVRWLLDCKDGTDAEYQQPFIKWITRPARFVIVRGKYQSIVDQLSVAAGLPITIPRKMLTYSGYDQNLPTRGIISKATHTLSGTDAGLSEIEIIMPPL